MSTKTCLLYDRICIQCKECDLCDLNSAKICDNCCQCIEKNRSDFAEIVIEDILMNIEEVKNKK